jgi:ParB/RepB/Spo0J family partition protein
MNYPNEIPLASIVPSPRNPRKSIDMAALAGLVESIKANGILQPILVRPAPTSIRLGGKKSPLGDCFEIVAGERRFRAASLAGLEKIPARVVQMDDRQAADARLVENDQREDITPSERAAAYQERIDAGITVDELAQIVGKSTSTVRSILLLRRMPKLLAEAVNSGSVPAGVAAMVCRIPNEEQREKMAYCVVHGIDGYDFQTLNPKKPPEAWQTSGQPLSYRDTKEAIKDLCMIELKGAPFSRKSLTLLPAAGSCDACPKRAGNDPDLVADGVRADICTDPACYQAKVAACPSKEQPAAATPSFQASPLNDQHKKESAAAKKKAEIGKAAAAKALETVSAEASKAYEDSTGTLLPWLRAMALVMPEIAWSDSCRIVAKRRGLEAGNDPRKALEEWAKTCAAPADAFGLIAELIAARVVLPWGQPHNTGQPTEVERRFLTTFRVDRVKLLKEAEAEKKGNKAKPASAEQVNGKPVKKTEQTSKSATRMTLEQVLCLAFGRNSEERLVPFRESGLPDAELKAKIGEAFGIAGGACGPNFDYRVKGGSNPEFWMDGKKVLTGKALIAKVREVMSIPLPVAKPAAAKPAPIAAQITKPKKTAVRSCRVCGCTEADCSQCIKKTGSPCHWVTSDLCSACEPSVWRLITLRHVMGDAALMHNLERRGVKTLGDLAVQLDSLPLKPQEAEGLRELLEREGAFA